MPISTNKLPSLKRLKQRAKDLRRKNDIPHAVALDLIANEHAFETWNALCAYVDNEASRDLQTDVENINREFLVEKGIDFSVFYTTETILDKSIIDATQSVRAYFAELNFHDYDAQGLGAKEHGKWTEAYIVTEKALIKSKGSFYRPKTKKGDPRMWFTSLPKYSSAGHTIAITFLEGVPYLLNLSAIDLKSLYKDESGIVYRVVNEIVDSRLGVSEELLKKLKVIAKEPRVALKEGDTSVGFTLESLLGLEANSSKLPDYKGIELKSGRNTKTRMNLFAQVADWKKSPFTGSKEILNAFGYPKEDDFKLYCTISSEKPNSQGLYFKCDVEGDVLEEWHIERGLVAVWPGSLLRQRLLEKHAETFWIKAESYMDEGKEYFLYKKVIHTRKPLQSQLLPLIKSGIITMDHLIKTSGKTGKTSEKGPLFKLSPKNLHLLFPEPIEYDLV
ncbi:MvaI/BcnI family restriction endonuclease [Vibrio tubiashii]|uniref:MvaI/BcnI family restriction endonuclease n=1 Tax=Vibrio tubiashii TaxID=29498 RepID=UPI00234E5C74|nr:MvaI/BcnI family restriction endonuclease [Vibrio tubiashii]WCP70099.1 MvaI/BcnI family restriction endonuclease [Vibrio tubiashii]